MTISAETAVAGPHNGDGSTTAFAFAFKCFSTSDVDVYLESSAGVQTLQTLTTHYSVSLNSDQDTSPGGTVTMVTPPASGEKLHIVSGVPFTRTDSFSNAGGFYPNVLNDARDKTTLQIQQLKDKVDRSMLAPVGEQIGALPASASRASKYLGFDSSGNPTALDAVNVGSTLTLGTDWAAALADDYFENEVIYAAQYGVVADAVESSGEWTGTDNTTNLNLAIAALRTKLTTDNDEGSHMLVLPPGDILVSSANFTSLRGMNWVIMGQGTRLVSKTAGKVVADFLHSRHGAIYNLGCVGDTGTPPRRGFQTGYIVSSAVSASNLQFHNCYTKGEFTEFADYNGGSEETTLWGGQRENQYAACLGGICWDAMNLYGRFSDYQTGDLLAVAVTGATQANPCVITAAGHGFSNGDEVSFGDVAGMTDINGEIYTVANATTDTFELSGTDSSAFGAYTSGGYVWLVSAYSMVSIKAVNASSFCQNGGNAIVMAGGVLNSSFDGYLYSLDANCLRVELRPQVSTVYPNDFTLNTIAEGTNLKSVVSFNRKGGGEVTLSDWKVYITGSQADDEIFEDTNESNPIYLSNCQIELSTSTTTPTNGLFNPTAKFHLAGRLSVRKYAGLDGLPDLMAGSIVVQDANQWGFPVGSYEILTNKNSSEINHALHKGAKRFYGTSAAVSDGGLSGTDYSEIDGEHLETKSVWSHKFTIADDAATSFDLPGATPAAILIISTNSGSGANGACWVRASASPGTAALGGQMTLSTGALAGTTGTDTEFTVAPHTDGKVYLENRLGSSRSVTVTVLSEV